MPMSQTRLFTPTEAAVLTRLPLKTVNNAIDRNTVAAVAGRQAGRATRLLDLRALLSLTMENWLADRFVLEFRQEVFEAIARAPRHKLSLDGGFLTIDLSQPRRELATALRALRRVRDLVVRDPDIMGGDPVFRGTRVPVHAVAAQLAQGASAIDVLEGYPRLTAEMVRLAPLYAAAYPLRGRPRTQPWRDRPPTDSSRRTLATLEAG
jgi:uncharacterized protein (DUF433 family)